ncbi:phospholipid carrier-dependent glycosyltransferase [Salinibacterium sp. G-O1]|uniref:dolichyl-phosphate-mannose--protein mannosyltransferase n=1 Tax=Salinibacterium sp. G-O1 TaxID=3046208 RepID=UPI0024B89D6A|nr:phospholipid carrier-dependent glycosyltransferase [Salinibacterium sp. G-O1]MDJ0335916.1 phospholipid carrier-dependent glycosyltransferase [Salinibacterium sp. G-O1]
MTTRAPREFDAVVAGAGTRIDDWWLRQSLAIHRLAHWGAPALVVVIAAITRLVGLGHPASLVFDETFYVKDAWTLFNLGYEGSWPAEADTQFNAGATDIFTTDPAFVVHPPLGKWFIGLGMGWLGPDNPVGWRIATVLAGILAVVLLMVVAKMLFRSALLATIAGLLFAIDGNAIVMSRVALLDNFVMLFALLGFIAILNDRGWSQKRLDLWLARKNGDWGPAIWWRPWLIAAGVAFGAATAVKWNGLYFLAALAVYTLAVDAMARRRAGIPFWLSGTIFKQGPVSFLLTVPAAVVTYLVTWIGWFVTSGGYSRQWAEGTGNAWTGLLSWVPLSLQSFWHFEVSVYNYHVGESRPHPYQANPLTWLFLIRPTSMYYQGDDTGGESISGIANPIIWWAATAAALYLVYRLIRFREWRVGLILAGLGAGYLPWLMYLNRTVFQFYTIAFEPYLILALTAVIGIVLGSSGDPGWRRLSGIRIVVIFLAVAIAVSVFFWPIWTGLRLDYAWLAAHWWLPTWR